MKKSMSILLLFVMVISLVACGNNTSTENKSVDTNNLTPAVSEATETIADTVAETDTTDTVSDATTVEETTEPIQVVNTTDMMQTIYDNLHAKNYPDSLIAALTAFIMQNSNLNPAAAEFAYAVPDAYQEFIVTTYENIDREEILKYYFAYGEYLVGEGILTNASLYKEDAYGYTAVGIGLLGWIGNRAHELINFTTDHEKPWYDIDSQLDFIDFEINTYYNGIVIPSFEGLSYEEALEIVNENYINASPESYADTLTYLETVEELMEQINK